MVRSICGGMCWFVDPAGNRGILVLYYSVIICRSRVYCLLRFFVCLRSEIRVSALTTGVVSIFETLVPILVVRYLHQL